MSLQGKINHNNWRLTQVLKDQDKIKHFKQMLKQNDLSFEDRVSISCKLKKLRASSMVKYRKRCTITGRSCGITTTGVNRVMLRDLVGMGMVPGSRYAS